MNWRQTSPIQGLRPDPGAADGGQLSDQNDIIAAANAGTLPELFVERLRRHRTDELGKAFRATLAKLHNDGTIDVLEPARQIATSPINQHDFFTVMHVYSELIPALDASVLDMLAAVKALSTRAGGDLAVCKLPCHPVSSLRLGPLRIELAIPVTSSATGPQPARLGLVNPIHKPVV